MSIHEGSVEKALPIRYEVRAADSETILRCRETPGVAVRVERHAYSEADARKLGERIILLDGAGSFGPIVDNERQLYNLDHHESCVRAFTSAACEQALTLVVKGLPLEKGTWTVIANDPDLDTVFAIWVLLNHRRLRELSPAARDRIVPLIRLEGAIDANGFDVADYCGLPAQTLIDVRAVLDRLQQIENGVKASGDWAEMDLYAYTLRMLLEIDRVVYDCSDLQDFKSVDEEYDHVEIGDDRVAVVCRDASGIYEVEQRLKRIWGDKLGIVALENDHGNFTLRRAAALAKIDLASVYDRFNLMDPAVDGRPPEKRWGGSDEVGGSPRPGGTRLTPQSIAAVLRDTFRPPGSLARVAHLATAVVSTLGLVLSVWGVIVAFSSFDLWAAHPQAGQWAAASLLTIIGGALLTWRFSARRSWLFGVRRWAGRDGWRLAPIVLGGALLGAAWTPAKVDVDTWSLLLILVVAIVGSVGAELWFRGFIHGLFLLDSKVQHVAGPWFGSRATIVSAILYAVTMTVAGRFLIGSPLVAIPGQNVLVTTFVGALIAGVGLGFLRERSLSIWPGVGLQILGSLIVAALRL